VAASVVDRRHFSLRANETRGGSTPDACFKLKAHVSMCLAVAFWRKGDKDLHCSQKAMPRAPRHRQSELLGLRPHSDATPTRNSTSTPLELGRFPRVSSLGWSIPRSGSATMTLAQTSRAANRREKLERDLVERGHDVSGTREPRE
jgi:hypothetical protein